MTEPYRLYENPGWGSAIVEAQLAIYGLPYRLVPAGGTSDPAAVMQAMRGVNPTAQVPALILPDGQVMTETAAMTLYLADVARTDLLVPGATAPERAAFLRWLIFLVAAVYSSFAYSDVPTRFVPGEGADAFRARVIEHRKAMWRIMEAEAAQRGGPWFLGARFSAIDIYLAMMTRWTPGMAWFQEETPKLWSCGQAASKHADIVPVMARNFP
jgi:GST-like protein